MSTRRKNPQHPALYARRNGLPLGRLGAAIGLALYGAGAAAATFTVTHGADDAYIGSLRAAVDDANASPGIDRIAFDPALDGTTVVVDSDELLITDDLIINGPGREFLTIEHRVADRPLFRVVTTTNAFINVDGLTLLRASNQALGVIDHDGVDGRIIVSESDIVNTATGLAPAQMRGAITGVDVEITIANSLIDGFYGNAGGGAIGLTSSGEGRMDIIETTVSNNNAPNGGAIYYADDEDGEITISHSLFENNGAFSGNGGAIYFQGEGGSTQGLLLAETAFVRNSAEVGGGALFVAAADTGTTVNVEINASSFAANRASEVDARGGAIEVGRAGAQTNAVDLDIVNSTISGNVATADGGGIVTFSEGSVIDIDILNSTIALNSSGEQGGGIFVDNPALVGVRLTNSIVSGNDAVNGGPDIFGEVDYSHSLLGDSAGAILASSEASLIDIDPLLDALCNQCYRTQLHPLARRSPAINSGDSSAAASDIPLPDTDQRVATHDRISGAAVDMGAFEYELPAEEEDDDDDNGFGIGGWLLALMALLTALRRARAPG